MGVRTIDTTRPQRSVPDRIARLRVRLDRITDAADNRDTQVVNVLKGVLDLLEDELA